MSMNAMRNLLYQRNGDCLKVAAPVSEKTAGLKPAPDEPDFHDPQRGGVQELRILVVG